MTGKAIPNHYAYMPSNGYMADYNAIASLTGAPTEDIIINNVESNMRSADAVGSLAQGVLSIPQGIAKLWGGNENLDNLSDTIEQNKWANQQWTDDQGTTYTGFYTPNSYDTLMNMAGQIVPSLAVGGWTGGLSGAGWLLDTGKELLQNANSSDVSYTGW